MHTQPWDRAMASNTHIAASQQIHEACLADTLQTAASLFCVAN